MKKFIAEVLNFTGHNTGVTVGFILAASVLLWTYGCESRVQSLTSNPKLITRGELQVEVDTFIALADIRFGQLNRQDEFKSEIFKHALLWAKTGTVNPFGLFVSLQAILGTGAIVDNATKRRKESKALRSYVASEREKVNSTS